jgi:uncharacterized protein YciI
MSHSKMLRSLAAAFAVVTLLAVSPTAAAPRQNPKMIKLYLVLLVAGPDRTQSEAVAAKIQAAHLEHLGGLVTAGRALAIGPMGDDGRVLGIAVLRATSPEEARAWAEADPAVKAGRLAVDVLAWWIEDGYLTPTWSTTDLEQLYFGFLVKGPKWSAEKTPESDEIQKQHMAHLNKSWEAGKLRLAGPIENGGDVRGIVIYRTASMAEAVEWASADPAVKAGRLAVDLHPWFVPRGTLK